MMFRAPLLWVIGLILSTHWNCAVAEDVVVVTCPAIYACESFENSDGWSMATCGTWKLMQLAKGVAYCTDEHDHMFSKVLSGACQLVAADGAKLHRAQLQGAGGNDMICEFGSKDDQYLSQCEVTCR